MDDLPGQARYVHELRRHLPGVARHIELPRPRWARGATLRTLAAWSAYPAVRPRDGSIMHGTDTFCAVPGVDVVTVHDLIPLQVSREWTARMHLRLFRRRLLGAELITLTRTWAERIARTLHVPLDDLHVIPQGCTPRAVAPGPLPAGFVPGKRHVLVVGAYRPYKRIHSAIAAVAGLPGTRLLRVGPPGDGYQDTCLEVARRTGCDFVDVGPVDEDDLAAYYAAADLLFYASDDEGFGLPPLEAMALGTTSVVSDIPVFRELYDGHVHYVRRRDDLRAVLAAALDAPLPEADLRAHAARFTWERTARATAEVHRIAAERHGKAVPAPAPAATLPPATA